MRPSESRVGDWSVEHELGRGAMGVVLRAHDAAGQAVAIKVLMASASPAARRRLETEASTLLRLSHPNLVRVLRTGEHRGMPYVVMELVDGESLARRIEREGPLEPRRAAAVALALAQALAHCHAHGVLHRDLKPANVLLDRRGEPRLVDFGLALDLDAARSRLTQEGNVLGTPGYWPPEQARGDLGAIDERSDVYALGATLYAMLAGEPPFVGENLAQLLEAALNLDPTPPSRVQPGVDADLDAIVLACLEKDPARRPASAEELAGILERWLAGERGVVAPARARVPWRLALGIALLGLAAGGWVLDRAVRARRAQAARLVEAAARRAPPDLAALALIDSALALRDDPAVRLRRAQLLVQLERPDEARAELERALAADPDQVAGWILRAELRPREERAAALGDLDQALRLDRASRAALLARAAMRQEDGDLQGAIADRSQVLRLSPGDPQAWIGRAQLRTKQGDLPGALEDYGQALRVDPDHARAHVLRGRVRERLGDQEGALSDYLRGAYLQEASGGLDDLAVLRGKRNEEQVLLQELNALLGQRETAELRYFRAQTFMRQGDLERARVDAERALELGADNPYRWALLATIAHRQGQYQESERHLTRAIELAPDMTGLYMNRSGVRIELDDWAGAEADLRRVLEAMPDQAAAHLRLGVLRHRQDRHEEALPHYERALALDPQLIQAYTDKASALLELGRPAEALPVLQSALARLPAGDPGRRRVEEDIARVQALLSR